VGIVSCRLTFENPRETGRGILYSAILSYDIGEHYSSGTILKDAKDQYCVVERIDYTLPSGTIHIYTPTPFTFPLTEEEYSLDLPIWIQMLHFAFQDDILRETIRAVHTGYNRKGIEYPTVVREDTIRVPPVPTGSTTLPDGLAMPPSYVTTMSRTVLGTDYDITWNILATAIKDDSMRYVILKLKDRFPFPFQVMDTSANTEELMAYLLYGKVKGYEEATQETDEENLSALKTLLQADGILESPEDFSTKEDLLNHLKEELAFSGHRVPEGFIHACHKLLPILVLRRGGI